MARTSDLFGATPTIVATTGTSDPGLTRSRTANADAPELGTPPSNMVRTRSINSDAAPATVAAAASTTGAGLDTLYGVDNESYLTDDQRKLARMIQGKFDASLNRRDRELARYGAPMLASNVEDESLARAMSLARGLNYVPPATPTYADPMLRNAASVPMASGAGRVPTTTPNTNAPTGAQTNAQWQRILSGLTSVIPLLFGKDAYGNFLNKGAIGWLKEQMFGSGASGTVSDAALENIVKANGFPTDNAMEYNPFTGTPIGTSGNYTDLAYGPDSGWGNDLVQDPFGMSNVDWGAGFDGGWFEDPGAFTGDWFGGV